MSAVDDFRDLYLQSQPGIELGKRYYEAFRFGNSEKMANELAAMVLNGTKTATSSLLWEYEHKGKKLMQVGDLHIVTNWNKEPVCIIETTERKIVPFNQTDAQFAYDYGEGDRSLEWWMKNLWDYYVEECAALGRQPSEDMPLVCERFRVVFPKWDD
jgi:uncharacterized protein YhfF